MNATRQSPTEIIRIKAAVRERDGYACVKCGQSNDEHIERTGRQLDVHRKRPGSRYRVEGCITVCRLCHQTKHGRKNTGPVPGCRFHDEIWEAMRLKNWTPYRIIREVNDKWGHLRQVTASVVYGFLRGDTSINCTDLALMFDVLGIELVPKGGDK